MAFKQRSTGSPLEFKDMGSSPAKEVIPTSSTQQDAPKKMGLSETLTKLKRTNPKGTSVNDFDETLAIKKPVPKPTGGFMKPPYKEPVGPTEKAKGYHGYK